MTSNTLCNRAVTFLKPSDFASSSSGWRRFPSELELDDITALWCSAFDFDVKDCVHSLYNLFSTSLFPTSCQWHFALGCSAELHVKPVFIKTSTNKSVRVCKFLPLELWGTAVDKQKHCIRTVAVFQHLRMQLCFSSFSKPVSCN